MDTTNIVTAHILSESNKALGAMLETLDHARESAARVDALRIMETNGPLPVADLPRMLAAMVDSIKSVDFALTVLIATADGDLPDPRGGPSD